MKLDELRKLSSTELKSRHEELKAKIFELVSAAKVERKDQTSVAVRGHKKEIAQILTILREQELKINEPQKV